MPDHAQYDDEDEWHLDDLFVEGGNVHVERMGDNAIWIGIRKGDDNHMINITTPRAKITMTHEVENLGEGDE